MPVIGDVNQNSVVMGRGYATGEGHRYASAIREMAQNISEGSNIEYFTNFTNAMMNPESRATIKNFFVENSADVNQFIDSPEEYHDHTAMMEAMFENDATKVLEYASISSYNPVMGLVFPLHKNILMNNIFDKGAINKAVAKTPKFTLTMEVRKLVKPDGTELDMFTQQNEMYDAIESTNPKRRVFIPVTNGKPMVPGDGKNAVLECAVYGVAGTDGSVVSNKHQGIDALSIDTAVVGLVLKKAVPATPSQYIVKDPTIYDAYADRKTAVEDLAKASGNTKLAGPTDSTSAVFKFPDAVGTPTDHVVVDIPPRRFEPGYGELDRQMMTSFNITYTEDGSTMKQVQGYLSGFINRDSQIMLNCTVTGGDAAAIEGVVIEARKDTSSAKLDTCQVRWDAITNIVEIPNAIPINTTISPEEVKDIQALYNEDQLSKIMSLFKVALGNYKDDRIHKELDQDYLTMPSTNKIQETFDFAPPEGYALDFVEWRHKTFMDTLDGYVTTLIQVLNDPNVTISVIGNPSLIRKITPTEYTYQSPSSIGPVEIDFTRTIVTSDKRVYNFVASDKLRDNKNLIILLNPRNTGRVIYCIYDYQLYLSNEIRNSRNYELPAIHAFERFKLYGYQPVQGRLQIMNPTGQRARYENLDPIGVNRMNDYTLYDPQYFVNPKDTTSHKPVVVDARTAQKVTPNLQDTELAAAREPKKGKTEPFTNK